MGFDCEFGICQWRACSLTHSRPGTRDVSVLVAEGLRIFELEGLQLLLACFWGSGTYRLALSPSLVPMGIKCSPDAIPRFRSLLAVFSGMSKMKHVCSNFSLRTRKPGPCPAVVQSKKKKKNVQGNFLLFLPRYCPRTQSCASSCGTGATLFPNLTSPSGQS